MPARNCLIQGLKLYPDKHLMSIECSGLHSERSGGGGNRPLGLGTGPGGTAAPHTCAHCTPPLLSVLAVPAGSKGACTGPASSISEQWLWLWLSLNQVMSSPLPSHQWLRWEHVIAGETRSMMYLGSHWQGCTYRAGRASRSSFLDHPRGEGQGTSNALSFPRLVACSDSEG